MNQLLPKVIGRRFYVLPYDQTVTEMMLSQQIIRASNQQQLAFVFTNVLLPDKPPVLTRQGDGNGATSYLIRGIDDDEWFPIVQIPQDRGFMVRGEAVAPDAEISQLFYQVMACMGGIGLFIVDYRQAYHYLSQVWPECDTFLPGTAYDVVVLDRETQIAC